MPLNSMGANASTPSPTATSSTNHWNRIKRLTNGTGAFKHSGKQRAVRLAKSAVTETNTTPRVNNDTGAAMAHWDKLKKVTNTAGTFKQSGKRRMKRLSKIMKSRHVATASNVDAYSDDTGRRNSDNNTAKEHDWLGEEVSGKANNNSRHVDPRTGRRCSNNEAMGVEERTDFDDDEEKDTDH